MSQIHSCADNRVFVESAIQWWTGLGEWILPAVRSGFHRGNPSLASVSQMECYSCKKVGKEVCARHPIYGEKGIFIFPLLIPIASMLHSNEFN